MGKPARHQTVKNAKVKTVPIASLVLDDANPRTHGERNLAAIGASLEEFGQLENLVIQKSTRRVIAGNGRIRELMRLGVESVEVREVDCDDATARRLSVILNRSAELAGWDWGNLETIIEEAGEAGFVVEDLGFTDAELEAIEEASAAAVEEAEQPEEPPPASDQSSQLGEKYQVLITCRDDVAQTELLQELNQRGYECRALIS